jgi:hypothetical protein
METPVFGVSASDPLTLAAVAATLALVALIVSLVPTYVPYGSSRRKPARGVRMRCPRDEAAAIPWESSPPQ